MNIGVNDIIAGTSQASFEADLAYTLDAMHTAWPYCKVGVSKVWLRNYDAQANTMAGWIDNVLATRSAWVTVSDDERVWMKGADNGAAMTLDGIHCSIAGDAERVNQLKAWMGY